MNELQHNHALLEIHTKFQVTDIQTHTSYCDVALLATTTHKLTVKSSEYYRKGKERDFDITGIFGIYQLTQGHRRYFTLSLRMTGIYTLHGCSDHVKSIQRHSPNCGSGRILCGQSLYHVMDWLMNAPLPQPNVRGKLHSAMVPLGPKTHSN